MKGVTYEKWILGGTDEEIPINTEVELIYLPKKPSKVSFAPVPKNDYSGTIIGGIWTGMMAFLLMIASWSQHEKKGRG